MSAVGIAVLCGCCATRGRGDPQRPERDYKYHYYIVWGRI